VLEESLDYEIARSLLYFDAELKQLLVVSEN